jgi:hypothetical protein
LKQKPGEVELAGFLEIAVSGPERDALVAACDCLISLHRSEGFGLAQVAVRELLAPELIGRKMADRLVALS